MENSIPLTTVLTGLLRYPLPPKTFTTDDSPSTVILAEKASITLLPSCPSVLINPMCALS